MSLQLPYRLEPVFAALEDQIAALESRFAQWAGVQADLDILAARLAAEQLEYRGPLLCCRCGGVIRPARSGHEQDPASHGYHPACADEWRRERGIRRRERG